MAAANICVARFRAGKMASHVKITAALSASSSIGGQNDQSSASSSSRPLKRPGGFCDLRGAKRQAIDLCSDDEPDDGVPVTGVTLTGKSTNRERSDDEPDDVVPVTGVTLTAASTDRDRSDDEPDDGVSVTGVTLTAASTDRDRSDDEPDDGVAVTGVTLTAASTDRDHDIAMAMQFAEADAHFLEARSRSPQTRSDGSSGSPTPTAQTRRLYVVEPATSSVSCRSCGVRLKGREMRLVFQRAGHRQLSSAHLACAARVAGLVRPRFQSDCMQGGVQARSRAAEADETAGGPSELFLSPRLDDAESAIAMAYLSELPEVAPSVVQHFLWPPPPRQQSSAASLRRRLLQTDGDFTPEDYELLSELDAQTSRANRKACNTQPIRLDDLR